MYVCTRQRRMRKNKSGQLAAAEAAQETFRKAQVCACVFFCVYLCVLVGAWG